MCSSADLVIVPFGNSLDIMSVIGPSLQTLQHHLKSFAGGPKVSTFSLNAFLAVPGSRQFSLGQTVLLQLTVCPCRRFDRLEDVLLRGGHECTEGASIAELLDAVVD